MQGITLTLGDPKNQAIMEAACAGLPERAHRKPELAALGFKEYEFAKTVWKEKDTLKKSTDFEEKVDDLSQEDFNSAQSLLVGGSKQKVLTCNRSGNSAGSGQGAGSLPGTGTAAGSSTDTAKITLDSYSKMYSAATNVLTAANSALSQAAMLQARLQALPEEAHTQVLKQAYLAELGRLTPLLESAKKDCERHLAFFPKELPDTSTEEELKQNVAELTVLRDNLDNHKKGFSKALVPMELFAKKG